MFNPTRPTIDRGITNTLHHPELAGVTWDASVTPANRAQTGRNISSKLARHITSQRASGPPPSSTATLSMWEVSGHLCSRCVPSPERPPRPLHSPWSRPPREGEVKRPLARPRRRTSTLVSATPSRWAHRTPESGSWARRCSPVMCTPNSTRAFGWHHNSSMPSYPQLAQRGQSPTDGWWRCGSYRAPRRTPVLNICNPNWGHSPLTLSLRMSRTSWRICGIPYAPRGPGGIPRAHRRRCPRLRPPELCSPPSP